MRVCARFAIMGGVMKWFSPAKINLTLKVLGRQPDGFHALDSVVVPITLGDDVVVEKARASSLTLHSDTVDLSEMPSNPEKNLAFRALRALEVEVGRALPTAMIIEKRIPLGGGLGGGSSNAATVLRAVNALWELGISQARLCEIGAALGSDVPLFVLDGTVRMRGRGEWVERIPMKDAPPLTLVLANDGTHCSTPQVYGALNAPMLRNILTNGTDIWHTLCLLLRKGDSEQVSMQVLNDLQMPCLKLFPGVARTAEALRAAGCKGVTLCGSGATVFAPVGSLEEGENVLAYPALSHCRRACVQTLPDGVMAAHGPLTPIVMVRIHVGQPPTASENN